MKKEILTFLGLWICFIGAAQKKLYPPEPAPPVVRNRPVVPPADNSSTTVPLLYPFKNGYALIAAGGNAFYINTEGKKIFDHVDIRKRGRAELGDPVSIRQYNEQLKNHPSQVPAAVIPFIKSGKAGVMAPDGTVLLDAVYTSVETAVSTAYWKLYKDNKRSYYLPDKTVLPFFDDIGYLDGNYFDVKQNGKWSIYSKKEAKIVTRERYDAFDFCGGCTQRPSYIYAKKNGKWGIIDWNENILVPFEYDHQHMNMRSDNWVTSFSESNKRKVINIISKKVFTPASNEETIISGLYITQQGGKYGAYDSQGTLIIPFEYDIIEQSDENYFGNHHTNYLVVGKTGKKGIINTKGKSIIPLRYDHLEIYDDFFVAMRNNTSWLLDTAQKVLLTAENVRITHINEYFYSSGSKGLKIFLVKQGAFNGLYFVDAAIYIKPAFYDISLKNAKSAHDPEQPGARQIIIGDKQGLQTVFDLKGNIILPEGYHDFYFPGGFPENKAEVIKNDRSGIFDIAARKEIIPATFNRNSFQIIGKGVHQLICGSMGDYTNPAFYFFDKEGNKALSGVFKRIEKLPAPYYLLQYQDHPDGHLIYNGETGETQALKSGDVRDIGSSCLVWVAADSQTGQLYDFTGKKFLPQRYVITGYTSYGLAENRPAYPVLYPFSNNAARIQLSNGKWNFINETGSLITKDPFDAADDFDMNGLAMVANQRLPETGRKTRTNPYPSDDPEKTSLKAGFINSKGTFIFPMEFAWPGGTYSVSRLQQESIAEAGKVALPGYRDYREVYGMGDPSGKIILPPEYDRILPVQKGAWFVLEKNKKYGIADSFGKLMVPVQYDNIYLPGDREFSSGTSFFPVLASENHKWFYITEDGNRLGIEGQLFSHY